MLVSADLRKVKVGDWVYDQTGVYEIIDIDFDRKEVELLEIVTYEDNRWDYGTFHVIPFSQFAKNCMAQ